MRMTPAAVALAAFATFPGVPAVAQELTESQIRQIVADELKSNPRLVLETILANPEVVMQAVAILREREDAENAAAAQAVLSTQMQLLTNDPNAPVLGNPEGDVTVVEFFDYNCPYCKKAAENVDMLIASDDGVRVVYREWPILSEGSRVAAKASLAARNQGLYQPFHEALMAQQGRLNEALIMKIARSVGLDVAKLRTDMEAPEVAEHIETSNRLAQALQFSGTPSFVIGRELVPGMVSVDQMQAIVDATRQGG